MHRCFIKLLSSSSSGFEQWLVAVGNIMASIHCVEK